MNFLVARARCTVDGGKAHLRRWPLGLGTILALALGPAACSAGGATSSAVTPGAGSSGGEASGTTGSSSSGGADTTVTPNSSSSGGTSAPAGGAGTQTGSSSGGNSGAGSNSSSGSTEPVGGSSSGGPTMPGTGSGGSSSGGAAPSGSSSGGSKPGGSSSSSSGGANGGGGAPDAGGGGLKPDQSTLPAITLHMAGDSTMSVYTGATTQEGWGQEMAQYFISKVTVDDQAQPGANIQTFYNGRWKTLIGNVKAGDYVMAAFGINDSGTAHGPVAVPAFTTQMGTMADEVVAKKATFIPTTSSPLQVWMGTMETNTRLQPYVDATIAFGMMRMFPVCDLNAAAVAYYNMIGPTAAGALTFNGDKAHFDKAGATQMALLATQALAKTTSPLAAYLK